MTWVYFTTAPDQIVAEMWRDLLRDEGVPANTRAGDTTSFLGVNTYPCRIVVQDQDVERAKELLEVRLGRKLD